MIASSSVDGGGVDEVVVRSYEGLLFDMDGTLVDSTAAIEKHWQQIADELRVPRSTITATSHGRRSIDTLQIHDPANANWDYVSRLEGRIPICYGQDARVIPGGRVLLEACNDMGIPWAVATSGTRALVDGWLELLTLPRPNCLVVAEDVERGKPDPSCYVRARERLGLGADAAMLVMEDSPAGVRAGKAAGCDVVALTTTHDATQVKAAGADWIVPDLEHVTLREREAGVSKVQVEIRPSRMVGAGSGTQR